MAVVKKTLGEIAELLQARCQGDPALVITGIAPLQTARVGQLSFLSNPLYRKYLTETKASAVILTEQDAVSCPVDKLLLDNPYAGYAKVAALFAHQPETTVGIHPTAVIAENCVIAPDASIGPYCVLGKGVQVGAGTVLGAHCSIGENTQIGAQCRLWPRVTVYHGVTIGNQVILHSGVVIGSDGFGMAKEQGRWSKIPQIGGVTIGNHVEIGANTTVDRGALEDTIIEDGVKLDNQIQIGHNVIIGANTAIAGCVGISGSTRIGRDCTIGGGTGIAGHLTIADHVTFTGMSGVYASIDKPGVYASGTGVQEMRTWGRNIVRLRQLDELARRLFAVEKQLKQTELESEAAE